MVLLVALGVVEGLAYAVGSYLKQKGVFYEAAPAIDSEEYLAERDPVLGWPSPFDRRGVRTPSGARPDPAAADSLPACVSLYGDSFTWSDEVADAHAWGSRLTRRLGCRVANYGVDGYGTDQAYLRYFCTPHDEAPVVVLNHASENILRNVTSDFNLLYAGDGRGFKPKFRVGPDGNLHLVPLPAFTPESHRRAVAWPETALPDDFFRPGGGGGVSRLRFPYTLSLLRAFGNFHVRAGLTGRARHEPFYHPDHPSDGLRVTAGILEAFAASVQMRGQQPVVTVLPNSADFSEHARWGRWPYQPLLDTLAAHGLHVVNVGEGMADRLGGEDPSCLFKSRHRHYNVRGYQMVADIVAEYLLETPELLRANAQPRQVGPLQHRWASAAEKGLPFAIGPKNQGC